jgi:hypothetical protein
MSVRQYQISLYHIPPASFKEAGGYDGDPYRQHRCREPDFKK